MKISKWEWQLIRQALRYTLDPRAEQLILRLGRHGATAAIQGVEPSDMAEPEPDWVAIERAEAEAIDAFSADAERYHDTQEQIKQCNLKALLMELTNRLVLEKDFESVEVEFDRLRDAKYVRKTTMIAAFTEWLNQCPEARELLAEAGYRWPMNEECGQKR